MMIKKLIRIELIFPETLIKAPLIYTAAKKFNLVPNISRAKVTETIGEVELELEGTAVNLERGVRYFERKGIEVKKLS